MNVTEYDIDGWFQSNQTGKKRFFFLQNRVSSAVSWCIDESEAGDRFQFGYRQKIKNLHCEHNSLLALSFLMNASYWLQYLEVEITEALF